MDLDLRRRFFAEEVECASNIRTPALVDALAQVPRERFLRPGPWHISAFWAEPATFVKPVASRNLLCYPPATSTASLT